MSGLFFRHAVHPYSVAVLNSIIYWTDWHTNELHYANKWDGIRRELVSGIEGLMGLVVVGPKMQAIGEKCFLFCSAYTITLVNQIC